MQKKEKITMDRGESRYIGISIHSIKDQNFVIECAEYSLLRMKDNVEESNGNCKINDHIIDTMISPQKRGTYTLKIMYEVADEKLIENIEVKVM